MSPSPRITEPLSWPVRLSCSRSRCTRSRSPRLPLVDDEFAKDVSEFETLDELKADLEKKLRTPPRGVRSEGLRECCCSPS